MTNEELKPKVTVIYEGAYTKGKLGICQESSFNGWLMWQHPDGQWVSLCPPDRLQTRAQSAVDVEALKRSCKDPRDEFYSKGWNDCIDHLSAQGHIAQAGGEPSMPKPSVYSDGSPSREYEGQPSGDEKAVHVASLTGIKALEQIQQLKRAYESGQMAWGNSLSYQSLCVIEDALIKRGKTHLVPKPEPMSAAINEVLDDARYSVPDNDYELGFIEGIDEAKSRIAAKLKEMGVE